MYVQVKVLNTKIRNELIHNLWWFLDFLIGNQEYMVDALALNGDEGRSMAAISFGEVPSNL